MNPKVIIDVAKPILEKLKPQLEGIAKKVIPLLKEASKEYGNKILQDIKDGKINLETVLAKIKSANPKFAKFASVDPELAKADIKTIDVEILTMDKLVQTIKENIVPSSNEVAALLKKDTEKIYLYTAFLKDGELLPIRENRYLIFVADAMARGLETQFKGNELIVLR